MILPQLLFFLVLNFFLYDLFSPCFIFLLIIILLLMFFSLCLFTSWLFSSLLIFFFLIICFSIIYLSPYYLLPLIICLPLLFYTCYYLSSHYDFLFMICIIFSTLFFVSVTIILLMFIFHPFFPSYYELVFYWKNLLAPFLWHRVSSLLGKSPWTLLVGTITPLKLCECPVF